MKHASPSSITQVPVRSATLQPATETNVYLIAREGVCGIVDAGSDAAGVDRIEAAWTALGRPKVNWIALTHRHVDHCGALRPLRDRLGSESAVILAHRADVEAVEERTGCRVDRRLQGGETLPLAGLGVIALHAPGHSPGHLHFYVKDERALICGDNVVGAGTTWIGPPEGHMASYLASLRGILALDPRWLGPGHGPAIDDPRLKVEALIAHRLERERQIVAELTRAPATPAELAARIYGGKIPEAVMPAAERTVEGHLIKLKEEYRAAADAAGVWSLR